MSNYYLTVKSYAGSSLSGSYSTIFGPNAVSGQPESSTVAARVVGNYPVFVDVERAGRQFALWVSVLPTASASVQRENLNRIFDTSRGMEELIVQDTSGCQRIMNCRPLAVFAHESLANSFIVRLEATDPRWFNAAETIQSASVSLATPIQRGNKTMLSACAGYSQAIVYDTSFDSDGGRWRDDDRAHISSWYATTGCPFPERAVIEWKGGAATAAMRIWNADTATIYLDFASGSTDMLQSESIRDVRARDGHIVIGHDNSGSTHLISFRDDAAYQLATGGLARYGGNIADKSASKGYTGRISSLTTNSDTACGVAMVSVFGTPYVAISTSQLTTIWHPQQQRTIEFGTGSDSHRAPYLSPGGDLYFYNQTDAKMDIYRGAVWFTADRSQAQADDSLTATTEPSLWVQSTTPIIATITGASGLSAVDGRGDVIFIGHDQGVTRLDMAPEGTSSSAAAVQYMTASYISEIMPGAVKGMWPFYETDAGNIAANGSVASVATRVYTAGAARPAQLYSPTGISQASVKPPRGFGVEGDSNDYLYSRIIAGCTTGAAANKVISTSPGGTGSPFLSIGIQTGDEIINYTNGSKTTITAIDSGTQLGLNADIFTAASQTYDIQVGGLSASQYDNWYISTWWYPTSLTGLRYLVAKGTPVAAASRSFLIQKASGSQSIKWEVSAAGTATTTLVSSKVDGTTINASVNQWLHIVAIHDTAASELRLWLNGSAAGSAAHTGGIYNTLTPLVVGAGTNASATITGQFLGTIGPTMVGTWSGSLNWPYLAPRMYQEGKRALDLANASQSRLYGTSNNVTSLAVSRDRHELIVGTASPGGAVSFIEWASGYRADEYDASSGDTDDNGSSFNLADVTRVSYGDDLLAISGSTSGSVHRLWIEQHFPAALSVCNQGNVDTDIALSFKPKSEKQIGWRRAQVFHLWNTSDQALTRYPVALTLDTATLITRKQMQTTGYDLRVIYGGVEVPRWIYNINAATTQIWFNVDVAPKTWTEGLVIYDNPAAGAPYTPLDTEPAFAWDSGSCSNTVWAYADFGSRKLGWNPQQNSQAAQWQPTELLPGVDPGALDRQWVTRTQGGGGGVGEVKTMTLSITADGYDAADRGSSATYANNNDLFLGKYTDTGTLGYNIGLLFRNVKLTGTDRILSARLRVQAKQEMGEAFIEAQNPDLSMGTTYETYILHSPDNGDRGEMRVKIYGDSNASAAGFTSSCRPGQRTVTAAARAWDAADLTTATGFSGTGGGWREGIYYDSPNFAPIIQEIINLSGWNSGQDLALVVKDNGSLDSNKQVRFYTAPDVPLLRTTDGSIVSEPIWYPAHRKITNQTTKLVIEYQSSIASVPMADADPFNDLAVAHSRKGVQAGEPFRNAWALSVPTGVVQAQHSGQFRATSRLPQPGAASAVAVSTETNNVAWPTTGSRFYAVTAVNAKGETVVGTEGSYNVVTADLSKPIRVSWQGVRKATGYRLYRGTTTTVYDTVYEIDGTATTFLDKNDPGKAAVVPSENTATVNAWSLYLRNQHGKLVPMFQTTASTESVLAGYGSTISHIFAYDSGPGTFGNNLSGSKDYSYWPATASNGDIAYFGAASKFYGLFFNVETAASYTNTVTWEYYNGAWTSFTPAYDGTAASSDKPWTQAGSASIGWDDGDVGSWAKVSINSVSNYWTRARVSSGTTITASPVNGSCIAGPATTPVASLSFASDTVVFALEPDTQVAADGQGAFADQVVLKLDSTRTPYILTGSTFLFQDQFQTVRVWSDLEQDDEKVLVRGAIRLERDAIIVDSASGIAVVAQSGEKLTARKDRPRRRLLRLTPGQNIVQLVDEVGAEHQVVIRHRDAWN